MNSRGDAVNVPSYPTVSSDFSCAPARLGHTPRPSETELNFHIKPKTGTKDSGGVGAGGHTYIKKKKSDTLVRVIFFKLRGERLDV